MANNKKHHWIGKPDRIKAQYELWSFVKQTKRQILKETKDYWTPENILALDEAPSSLINSLSAKKYSLEATILSVLENEP